MVKSNEDPTQLFLIYKNSLNEIKGTESIEICLRKFELNLLTVLGYEINFSTEYKTGEKILPEKNYIYTPESGFVENQTGYKGLQLLNISNKRFSTESLAVAKKINQQTLEYYFDELNINSRLFFK